MDALTLALRAIADPTRRRLVELLLEGERSASDLADQFELGRPSISKHLGTLKEAGLVGARSKGRQQIYKLNLKPLSRVRDWLECCGSTSASGKGKAGKGSSRPSGARVRASAGQSDWRCWQ